MNSRMRRILLPGLIFQSTTIAGGYGTGREIVEYFLSLGPRPGLAAMAVSTLIWSAVCAATFVFARRFGCYDYRAFFQHLLGRPWQAFEIVYVAQLLLVLAVVAAAAGAIAGGTFGAPYALGVGLTLGGVGLLAFLGSSAIERFFAGWSVALYAVWITLFVWSAVKFGGDVGQAFEASSAGGAWFGSGVRYAGYNLASAIVAMMAVRHLRSSREAVQSGLLAGVIGMAPALLFFVAAVPHWPGIVSEVVPASFVLEALGSKWFVVAYQIVLLGTLIETGSGMIHAVNERLAGAWHARGRDLARWARPAVAIAALGLALGLAEFGLVDLIARGYGTITWGWVALYAVPVLTVGLWKLRRRS